MLTHQTLPVASYILPSGDSLQHSAQQSASSFPKRGSKASFGNLSPSLQGCSSSRHLAFNPWASSTSLVFISFNHTREKGRVILQHATSEMEREKEKAIHNLHIEGLFHKCFSVRCLLNRSRREGKNTQGSYFGFTPGIYNTLCLTPFWLDEASFPQCMRQYGS